MTRDTIATPGRAPHQSPGSGGEWGFLLPPHLPSGTHATNTLLFSVPDFLEVDAHHQGINFCNGGRGGRDGKFGRGCP